MLRLLKIFWKYLPVCWGTYWSSNRYSSSSNSCPCRLLLRCCLVFAFFSRFRLWDYFWFINLRTILFEDLYFCIVSCIRYYHHLSCFVVVLITFINNCCQFSFATLKAFKLAIKKISGLLG